MKKKLESIEDRMFTPLQNDEAARAVIGMEETAYISVISTNSPSPDEVFDHG
jgi:hypothetical protein